MASRYWGNFLYSSSQETGLSFGSSGSGSSCFEVVSEHFMVPDLVNVENY